MANHNRGVQLPGEALALRPSDVDAAGGLVRVRRGKGGRPRWAGIDPEALAAVDARGRATPSS